MNYRTRLETFTEHDLPDLDEVVLGSLEFLSTAQFPSLNIHAHQEPLVVGSGNAVPTGEILFQGTRARSAEEGIAADFFHLADSLYIISASGSKHAIGLAERAKVSGLPVYLVTTNGNSKAAEIVGLDHTFVYPHIREPYTYNTSTYLSMLFGLGTESPLKILEFIESEVAPKIPDDLSAFSAFLMTIPPQFHMIRGMFETKFDELFGPHIVGRAFTTEEVKHAKTVITSPTQCYVGFGDTTPLGNPGRRIAIPLPHECGPGALIAIGYYVIGRIQKAHPPYFKDNISAYTKEASELFGHPVSVVVENT